MSPSPPRITIYTDGGCHPNPGPGGWGAVILQKRQRPRELSGGGARTTNNRMELTAALEALKALEEPSRVRLFTDSTYLKNGITRWIGAWRRRGWKTQEKTAVKNQDLWEALQDELERHQVSWKWVRGHAGNRWNERADRLARRAIPRPGLPLEDESAVHVFAACACSPRSGVGGWAVVLRWRDRQRSLKGRARDTTANRMHLTAAIEGLKALRRKLPVHLYTASDYVRDGATQWIPAWRVRNWTTRARKPVSHRDLWEELAALQDRHEVTWHLISSAAPPAEMAEARRLADGALHPLSPD